MYAVIYWQTDDCVFPLLNSNKTLRLFSTVKEADEISSKFEESYKKDCRVITIDGVKE